MKIDNKIRLVTVLSAVMLMQMLPGAIATPKHRTPSPIIFDIVHAIPAGFGADIVDVYANDKLIIDNATPGAVKAITGESGPVVVSIYANGVVPGPTTQPVLTTSPIYLSSNSKYSFVAHLTATGEPIIDIFKNMTVEPGSKRAWLTVRHVAAAPAVNVKIDRFGSFSTLSNGYERKKSLSFETHTVGAIYDETTTVAVAPISIFQTKGINTVLYIWGAKSKGGLAFLKEEIPSR